MKIRRFRTMQAVVAAVILSLVGVCAQAQQNRYVVIDQDAMGPAGTDMNSIMVFLQSPGVNVLGITVVTGDGWRDEEVAHTLRLLELLGRTDIPVVAGLGHAHDPHQRVDERVGADVRKSSLSGRMVA